MRRSILLIWSCLAAASPVALAAQAPHVAVDPRIELMSVVFRLAGSPEYGQCRLPAYARAIDKWFAPFREHEAVQIARELRLRIGISYDAPMNLAVHLGNPPGLVPRVTLGEATLTLDDRWRRFGTAPFLSAVRSFATDTRFMDFMDSQAELHRATIASLGSFIESEIDFAWFGGFFGDRPSAEFYVIPGLCNGGANYGSRFRSAYGVEELYGIVGVSAIDSAGMPRFDRGFITTVVHEFSHSYVNPLVDRHRERFAASAPRVFVTVSEEMRSLAYGAWPVTLAESLVRASVIRYVDAKFGAEAAKREITAQQGLGFIWMDELSQVLAGYERDRKKYPTFESFLPKLVAYYEGLATRMDQVVAAYESTQPQVISFSPAHDAVDVDPSTTEIAIRFDRPMTGGYSINYGPGGKATYPEVLGVAFDPAHTVLTLRVNLEPDREYEMILTGAAFRSQEGVPLGRHVLRFRTSPAR
jgi:hypothetical protein